MTRREELARAWADALEGTSFVALDRPELEQLTLRLAGVVDEPGAKASAPPASGSARRWSTPTSPGPRRWRAP